MNNQQFTPKKNFKSSEFAGTVYLKGLTYTCKPGPEHDKLRACMQRWLEEGKIKLVSPSDASPTSSKLKGAGTVS